MKKVTLQDIADSLGVSRISVWKVFSGCPGVSDDLRNKIISKASELEYNFPKDFQFPDNIKKAKKQRNISIAISKPQTSFYWINVLHELAKELSKSNVNLLYTYLPSQVSKDYSLPSQLSNGSIDGIIIMNVYNDDLLSMISKLHVPKVYLDTTVGTPFEKLYGDLVITTGKATIVKITSKLIAQNKSKIGFIGDIHSSYSNRERYDGFVETMNKHHLTMDQKYCFTDPIPCDTANCAILKFLDQLDSYPDALICLNDDLAYILLYELMHKGIKIPEDLLIITAEGMYQNCLLKDMTAIQTNIQNIGIRLANQILYRIKHPDLNYEMVYINSKICANNSMTSTSSENDMEQSFSQ